MFVTEGLRLYGKLCLNIYVCNVAKLFIYFFFSNDPNYLKSESLVCIVFNVQS